MLKQLVNEALIEIAISPNGPILIKSGSQSGDPTKPDMEFVETFHLGGRTVYLPGSSLKGVIRSHAERIVRTLAGVQNSVWSCDPLKQSCGEKNKERNKSKELNTREIYKQACHICKTFGSTSLAARFRICDAHPLGSFDDMPAEAKSWVEKRIQLKKEERNGVAIDRVFGSVAVGPFNYEVVTSGVFQSTIYLKNFTLWQMGLLAFVLRDLQKQRVAIGFAKTRGMGNVDVHFLRARLRYPSCEIRGNSFTPMNSNKEFGTNEALGVGALTAFKEDYGFPRADKERVSVPDEKFQAKEDPDSFGIGVFQEADNETTIVNLFRACALKWKELVTQAAEK